jgi:hypothetical protein
VAQIVHDAQRFGPSLGCGGVAEGVQGVAQPSQRDGLAEPVVRRPPQIVSPLETADRVGVLASVLVHAAQAVPGVGLAAPVADQLEQPQRFAGVRPCLVRAAQVVQGSADRVVSERLPRRFTALHEQFQRPLGVRQGGLVLPAPAEDARAGAQRTGLLGVVTDGGEPLDGLLDPGVAVVVEP